MFQTPLAFAAENRSYGQLCFDVLNFGFRASDFRIAVRLIAVRYYLTPHAFGHRNPHEIQNRGGDIENVQVLPE